MNVTFLGASKGELMLVVFLATLVFVGTKVGAMGAWLGRWLDREQ